MGAAARTTCTGCGAALAALLASFAGCGLDATGLREGDVAEPEDGGAGDADGIVVADAEADAEADDGEADDGEADDGETDDGPACIPGETSPCAFMPGTCGPVVQTCLPGGEWGECTDSGPPPTPEACDGLDSDCDGLTDEDLGRTTCGVGACRNTMENCAGGVLQTCVPVAPSTCDAPPAYCHTTTEGTDECGSPCTKLGPEYCYTVHPACLTSGPGTPTDNPSCDTPRGRYNCGLTCEEWPNSIGADCEHCVNIVCEPRSGEDEAQFRCNNLAMPPTP